MAKRSKQMPMGLIVPSTFRNSDFRSAVEYGRQQAIEEYNRNIAPLKNIEKGAFGRFMLIIGEINGTAQVQRGSILRNRLQELAPEFTKAATVYSGALIRQRPFNKGNQELEQVIEGIKYITSAYQDAIANVLDGTDNGEKLSRLHEGESAWWGSVFDPFSVDIGGRPQGMTAVKQFIGRWGSELKEKGFTDAEISDQMLTDLRDDSKRNGENAELRQQTLRTLEYTSSGKERSTVGRRKHINEAIQTYQRKKKE